MWAKFPHFRPHFVSPTAMLPLPEISLWPSLAGGSTPPIMAQTITPSTLMWGWFTQWLWDFRTRVERHYQAQRRRPTPSNRSRFRATKSRYLRECRRRRRRSWRAHMEWTPGPGDASRLMRVLNRKEVHNLSTLLKPDGTSTCPGEETADLLFRTFSSVGPTSSPPLQPFSLPYGSHHGAFSGHC